MEDPKTAKGIVKREIVQVITPGTVTETSLLDEKANNYLVSVYLSRGGLGLAAVDISTGEFSVTQTKGKAGRFRLMNFHDCSLLKSLLMKTPKTTKLYKMHCCAWTNVKAILARKIIFFQRSTNRIANSISVSNLIGCTDLPFAIAAAGAAVAYYRNTTKPSGTFT